MSDSTQLCKLKNLNWKKNICKRKWSQILKKKLDQKNLSSEIVKHFWTKRLIIILTNLQLLFRQSVVRSIQQFFGRSKLFSKFNSLFVLKNQMLVYWRARLFKQKIKFEIENKYPPQKCEHFSVIARFCDSPWRSAFPAILSLLFRLKRSHLNEQIK